MNVCVCASYCSASSEDSHLLLLWFGRRSFCQVRPGGLRLRGKQEVELTLYPVKQGGQFSGLVMI